MEISSAVETLSALAHPGRLLAFRRLVRAGPDGLGAGQLARELGVPPSTLTMQMAVLVRSGLVDQRRAGRHRVYAIIPQRIADTVAFLAVECCEGAPDTCLPKGMMGTQRRESLNSAEATVVRQEIRP